MEYLALALLAVLPLLVIAAGLRDLTTMTIPNWISGLLIVAFFPAAFAAGLESNQVFANVGVGLVALVIGATMFALRWLGGGDAKLMAAACLWMGLQGVAPFILWTAVAGGAFSLALMFVRSSMVRNMLPAGPAWFGRLMEPKGDIPYGVAIAIGALLAFPSSVLFAASMASS